MAQADAVLAGDVPRREEPGSWLRPSSDQATCVVRVSRVHKGDVRAEREVIASASGASCGLELPGYGPGLFVTWRASAQERDPDRLTASLRGCTRAGDVVPAFLGAGRAPTTPAPAPPNGTAPDEVPVGNVSADDLNVLDHREGLSEGFTGGG